MNVRIVGSRDLVRRLRDALDAHGVPAHLDDRSVASVRLYPSRSGPALERLYLDLDDREAEALISRLLKP